MNTFIKAAIGLASALMFLSNAAADQGGWSGSYIGFNAGYAQADQDFKLNGTLGAIDTGSKSIYDGDSTIGGIQGGAQLVA